MQAVRTTLTAMANTIRSLPVFGILSSPDNRALRWAEDRADEAAARDFSLLSDAELRGIFSANHDLSDPHELAGLLSAASTAVNRRLGVWRIFDADDEPASFAGLRQIADQVIGTARFAENIKYFTEPDFADTSAFHTMLEGSLDAHGLNGHERVAVRGLVYAAEKTNSTLPENISLPAEFYEAIAVLDDSRDLRFTPTRQQMVAAALLTRGVIVEMDAGEGKTISTALAALAFAAAGSRVHVLTANDYLAVRDAEWLAPVYESLGVSVAAVSAPMDEDERRSAYARTVVYSTVREIGFDYLKDNLKLPPERPVQSGVGVAIVDEADHVLIDQHRTPLIISGSETSDTATVEKSHRIVRHLLELHAHEVARAEQELNEGACSDADAELAMLYAADPDNETLKRITSRRGDSRQRLLTDLAEVEDTTSAFDFENRYYYRVDTQTRTVRLTERGEAHIEANLGTADSDRRWAARSQVHQFLRAYTLFTRNIDYVVEDDGVVLVDPFNGRLLPDNRYLHGLQTALEAKEGLPPTPDSDTLAQITIPGLMDRYAQVSGLTGTAVEAQDDFQRDYGLPVIRVEPAERSRRADFPPAVLDDTEAQRSAILADVRHWRSLGRPVLIGTASVEESEEISSLLDANGVPHHLLNAVNSEREAQIIRDAGSFGAVTVATNMAGRGTDIILEPDLNQRILSAARAQVAGQPSAKFIFDCATLEEASMLAHELAGLVDAETSCVDGTTVQVTPTDTCPAAENVTQFGLGLCVIGAALNSASRIDRQLRGRAGRQGAFGASRFIVSAQDTPIAFSRHADSLRRARPGDARRVHRLVQSVQSESDADARWRSALSRDYASVFDSQTLAFYRWRQEVLNSHDWRRWHSDSITRWAAEFTKREFAAIADIGYDSVFDRVQARLWAVMGIDCGWMYGLGEPALADQLGNALQDCLARIRNRMGHGKFDELSREATVRTADELWPRHLEYLQDVSLSCSIAGPTHRTGVGDFIELADRAYLAFLVDVNHEAVPRLLALGDVETHPTQVEHEISIDDEILGVLA